MTLRTSGVLAVAVSITTLTANPLSASAEHPGDRLAPELLDPGIIESWDVVHERAANMPDTWDANPKDREDARGIWVIPSRGATFFPHSGTHYATNKWGDTSMGIGFDAVVDVLDVHVAGQAGPGVWPPSLVVVGFRDGVEIAHTPSFGDIGSRTVRLPLDLHGVDRIVFEAAPAFRGAAWFGIDDLVYRGADGARTVIDFEDCRFDQKLTGTAYRGLIWEEGSGPFDATDDAIHAPMEPEDDAGDVGNVGAPALPPGPVQNLATLPDLMSDFQSVKRGDAGQWSYPADTCGAVGTDHFVTSVNRVLAVHDKSSGALLEQSSLGSFLPGSSGDPRIAFDHDSQKWFVIASNFSNRIYIAVSLTDDATGSWYKTSWNTSTGADSGHWPDYPTLGVNDRGVYVSAYMVGSPTQMTIFAIDKAPMVDGSPSLGTVTAFRELPWEGAIQPVIAYSPLDVQYFVSRVTAQSLRLRTLSGPLTNPSLDSGQNISVQSHEPPDNVPALGSNTPLHSVGARMMNACYRDGLIYAAHTIKLNDRAACRWYQIDPVTVDVVQQGNVTHPDLHMFFPAVCPDEDGNLALGCSGANGDQYAGAYYTGRRHNDSEGQMATPVQYRAGAGPQNNIDSFGRNRWGDYSLTTADPVDGRRLWTLQKYAHSENVWGTHAAELFILDGPGNDFCGTITAASEGFNAFDTTDAATDGFPEPAAGCLNGAAQIEKDVWFKFTPPCSGEVTLRLCGTSFDSAIAVYESCPGGPDEAIACDDDSCGGGQAEVSFFATPSMGLYIRIGSTAGGEGPGTLEVVCTPGPPLCAPDLDGSGDVGFSDVVALLATWGPCPGCAADLDGDGTVGFGDLLSLLAAWGPCP